jgi:hypothetical protein
MICYLDTEQWGMCIERCSMEKCFYSEKKLRKEVFFAALKAV